MGLADDIALPIVVLSARAGGAGSGRHLPAAAVAGAPLRGSRQGQARLYLHLGYAELLQWLDGDEAPRLALVEHVPGHYSPFVHTIAGNL